MGFIALVGEALAVKDTTFFVPLVTFIPEPDMVTDWMDPTSVRFPVSVGVIGRGVKPN